MQPVYIRDKEGGDGEEGDEGESVVSETSTLLAYTLRYVSLSDLGRQCQFGLR